MSVVDDSVGGRVGRTEGQGVAEEEVHGGDDAYDGESLHDGGKYVLHLDHAAVIQPKTRNGHHEHDGRGDDHEGGISGTGRA